MDSAFLPESILIIWAVAQNPCEFCENGGECDEQLCRKSVEEIYGGKPVSTTLYPGFSPLQKDVFSYCKSYKQVVEAEPKKRAADTFFFPAFLRLAKSEGGERFKKVDVDLILKAICCIYNNAADVDFRYYVEVLCGKEYKDFSKYLVDWSRESQKSKYHNNAEGGGYRTDLIMNMAVMLHNLLQITQQAFTNIQETLADTIDFPRGDELAAAW